MRTFSEVYAEVLETYLTARKMKAANGLTFKSAQFLMSKAVDIFTHECNVESARQNNLARKQNNFRRR